VGVKGVEYSKRMALNKVQIGTQAAVKMTNLQIKTSNSTRKNIRMDLLPRLKVKDLNLNFGNPQQT
jgi:hypothetical protein